MLILVKNVGLTIWQIFFILNVVNRIRIVCNWKAGINYSFIMVPGGAVIEELSICLLFYFTGNCVSVK